MADDSNVPISNYFLPLFSLGGIHVPIIQDIIARNPSLPRKTSSHELVFREKWVQDHPTIEA